jgi:hypothetical protein
MKYSNIIIHAGGKIEGSVHTNSLESIYKNVVNINSKTNDEVILCELDCCKLKDYYILAHDGFEKAYNLHTTFANLSKNDVLNHKLKNKFTPMYFYDLYNFIKETNINVNFIIDSKHDLDDDFINHILQNMKEYSNKIILQVYKKTDIFHVKKYKFSCLYALWKYNSVAFNKDIKKNLEYINKKKIECIGISLNRKYYDSTHHRSNKKNLIKLQKYNYKIFIHGEKNTDKCLNAIRDGYGLFTHNPEHFFKKD